MIGLSREEMAAMIREIEEKAKSTFSRDAQRAAWVDEHIGTLSFVAKLIAENNQRLYEDLIALGVLEKDNDS